MGLHPEGSGVGVGHQAQLATGWSERGEKAVVIWGVIFKTHLFWLIEEGATKDVIPQKVACSPHTRSGFKTLQ